jgi:hypothetical protein
MRYWVQYHNYEKLGQLPGEGCGIRTDKQDVLDTVGDTIFLIVGISESPRQYLLWEQFVCDEVLDDCPKPLRFAALGDGWFLVQRRGREPLLNVQPGFKEYLEYTGRFARGFHDVTDHPFLETLLQLSETCKPRTKKPI